jgi:hypothetical protein
MHKPTLPHTHGHYSPRTTVTTYLCLQHITTIRKRKNSVWCPWRPRTFGWRLIWHWPSEGVFFLEFWHSTRSVTANEWPTTPKGAKINAVRQIVTLFFKIGFSLPTITCLSEVRITQSLYRLYKNGDREIAVRFPAGQEMFLFFKTSILALTAGA